MIDLNGIIGQTAIKQRLIHSVRSGKVPSSQLFTTVDGGAGLPLVLAFAKFLACDQTEVNNSCNTCKTCLSFDSFNYPDLHFSFPFAKSLSKNSNPQCSEFRSTFIDAVLKQPYLTKSKWNEKLNLSNQQTIIPTSEAHAIIHELSITRFADKPRIIIIWQADKLNSTAANKLLKHLEEPGDSTYFFLISSHPERILDTIKSRCIQTKVPLNNSTEIIDYLSNSGIDNSEITGINLGAQGSIGTAIDLLNQSEKNNIAKDLFVEWVRLLFAGNVGEIVKWSEKTATLYREDIKFFLNYSVKIFRQSFLINTTGSSKDLFKHNSFDVARFSPFIHSDKMNEILTLIETCASDITRNANPKIAILDTSLQLTKYIGKT